MSSSMLYVFITGTSTGIGNATAGYLYQQGFKILAGVRKAADGEELRKQIGDDLQPVIIDMCDQQAIQAAVAKIATITGEAGLIPRKDLFAKMNETIARLREIASELRTVKS